MQSKQDQDRQAKIEKALKDLKDRDAKMRMCRLEALGWMKAKEYTNEVAKLLNDEDEVVRIHATQMLGHMKAVEYAKQVAELLKDEEVDVREDSAWALGSLSRQKRPRQMALPRPSHNSWEMRTSALFSTNQRKNT